MNFTNEEGYLQDFYNRVKIGKSSGKDRMALIQKIFVSCYQMLKKEEKYYWVDEVSYQNKLKKYQEELLKIKRKYKNNNKEVA